MQHTLCFCENLNVNQTHFKGVNSGQFLEIDDSPDKRHQLFGANVISSSGNVHPKTSFKNVQQL